MHFKNAGDKEHGHSHPFDHVSLLSNGAAKVTVSGVSKSFYAPQVIFIKKDLEHEIEALEDNTEVTCIHAIRNGERVEDIIDPESYVVAPGGDGAEQIGNDGLTRYILTPKTK
jgi:quercetin dioxygenase-like cupin family protein